MEIAQIEFIDIEENEEIVKLIERVSEKCFEIENLNDKKLYLSIILTNPENIRRINNEYRKIKSLNGDFPEVLGVIMISIERVKEQALEYGHSFERELSYMIVHGFYHLMGYDHIEEKDKKEMREKEENILNILDIKRG